MPVLDTGIHAFLLSVFDLISAWMAGSRPAMTGKEVSPSHRLTVSVVMSDQPPVTLM
ncbi:MAG: hypothetical protein ABJZ76_09685 [Alphaproteobacteria bacterium]